MIVNMVQNDKREEYGDLSRALTKAYVSRKAVLVTRYDEFVCIYIPYDTEYTLCIDDGGVISLDKGEFVEFDDEETYDWEDCVFEVIDTDNINITVIRD